MCVIGWNCLPLAQGLSIEVAAISVIGCFATTRERALVSRSFSQSDQLDDRLQDEISRATHYVRPRH
jgi:hypothetical protein